MLRVTLAGVRTHASRLISVTLATAIAVAFLSATILLNSSLNATFRATVTSDVQHADLIIAPAPDGTTDDPALPGKLAKIANLPGVAEAFTPTEFAVTVSSAETSGQFVIAQDSPSGRLNTLKLSSGRLPAATNEAAVDASLATQLHFGLGATVRLNPPQGQAGEPYAVQIVGLVKASASPLTASSQRLFLSTATTSALSAVWSSSTGNTQLALEPSANRAQLTAEITGILNESATNSSTNDGMVVLTPDEYVAQRLDALTGGSLILLIILLVFVSVALFVAALVIQNTFSVLVAQRSRELALLRCIGASKRQVFGSVLVEAVVVALVAGVLGVGLGIGVISLLVAVSGTLTGTAGAQFGMDASAVIWPILTGLIVVLLAALAPAIAASRTAPIAALRPSDAPQLANRAGKFRLSAGLVLVLAGAVLLGLGASGWGGNASVVPAIGGAILSAIGVFSLAVFIVPAVVGGLGRAAGRYGVPAKLAGLNALRNRRRTASTALALMIGVTLVTTVATGASVASATVHAALDAEEPIDMTVHSWQSGAAETSQNAEQIPEIPARFDDATVARIRAIDGVQAVVNAELGSISGPEQSFQVIGVSPEQYRSVARSGADELAAGSALVGRNDGFTAPLSIVGPGGTLTLNHLATGAGRGTVVVTPTQFSALGFPNSQLGSLVLIRVASGLSTSQITGIQAKISAIAPNASVSGGVLTRVSFEQLINVLLLVMSGLLAVAILIAVIGIGNTLSLSVLERTRENALLRALGLTKRQLRWMLSLEAILSALAAALLGAALGVAYGSLGTAAILHPLRTLDLELPWAAIAGVMVLASLAGLISSLLPARRAARLSPIAGLAVE